MIRRSRRAGTMLLAALALPAAIVAAAPSASPAFNCIQNLSTNSNITGGIFLSANINIRTGPSTNCTAVGEGEPSDAVTVHCRRNESDGLRDYLTDRTTGKKGWSSDQFVGYPRTPATC